MEWVGLLSVALLFVTWNVVGLRLLWLAQQTRGFPELALGSGLLLLAGLGFPLFVLHGLMLDRDGSSGAYIAVGAFAHAAMAGGVWLVALFTSRVFRSGVAWATALSSGIGVLLIVQAVASILGLPGAQDSESLREAQRGWATVHLACLVFVFGWAGVEAILYRRSLLKRIALGLADAVVANRLLLWGTLGLSSAVSGIVNIALLPFGTAVLPVIFTLSSAAGLLNSACLWLAFLPPRRYLAWVRSGPEALA